MKKLNKELIERAILRGDKTYTEDNKTVKLPNG